MSHVHDVVIVIMAGLAIWACSVGMQVAMGPTHVQVMKLKVVGQHDQSSIVHIVDATMP